MLNTLHVSQVIHLKRKQLGVTQEELAQFMGVSKASVSKWETSQSYPDVTLLPRLASYFNITIDELVGYTPQMEPKEIQALYRELSAAFCSRPFEEVYARCQTVIRDYYSCFPLLLQMAGLLLNHGMLAPNVQVRQQALQQVVSLCRRVQEQSGVLELSRRAREVEIMGHQLLGHPEETLRILKDESLVLSQDTQLLIAAYRQLGDTGKARHAAQVELFQHLLFLVSNLMQLLSLHAQEAQIVPEILKRGLAVIDAFEMDVLHPNTVTGFYLLGAQALTGLGNTEEALDLQERYCQVCLENFFPAFLHGDAFFTELDSWFADFELGPRLPRSEEAIRRSLLEGLTENPAFSSLSAHPRFQSCVSKLKTKFGG